jgi:hypothetical protein
VNVAVKALSTQLVVGCLKHAGFRKEALGCGGDTEEQQFRYFVWVSDSGIRVYVSREGDVSLSKRALSRLSRYAVRPHIVGAAP